MANIGSSEVAEYIRLRGVAAKMQSTPTFPPEALAAPDPFAKARAVQHANRGRSLEKLVALPNEWVRIAHMGQAVLRLPNGKVVVKRGTVDFGGTVNRTGRAVFFDAKVCKLKSRFPVGSEDHFPRHQRLFLIEMGGAGALAGLLIEAQAEELQCLFWLPWMVLLHPLPSIEWTDPRLIQCGSNDRPPEWKMIFDGMMFAPVPAFIAAPGESARSSK